MGQQALDLGFTRTEVYMLRNSFEMLDIDGGGVLGFSEVERAVQLMGWRIPHAKLQKMVQDVDDDGSGELDFGEFLPFMRRVEQEFIDAGIPLEKKEETAPAQEASQGNSRDNKETIPGLVKAKIQMRERAGDWRGGANDQ